MLNYSSYRLLVIGEPSLPNGRGSDRSPDRSGGVTAKCETTRE
jgi:hypothetical protein